MRSGARFMVLATAATLVAACTGATAPVQTIAPPPPLAWPATPDPCGSAVSQLEALANDLAADLTALRPLVVSASFSNAKTLTGARKVSATLTVYGGLEQTMGYCPATRALAQQVAALRKNIEAALVPALNAGMFDDSVERAAAVKLVGLLPKVVAISKTNKSVADTLGIEVQVAQVPASALKPVGSLTPVAGAANPTAQAAAPPGSGTDGSASSGSAATAQAYQASANQTYAIDVPRSLDALTSIDCTGLSGDECYYVSEEGAVWVKLATTSVNAHIAFMNSHPAAQCFLDAYKADRGVAKDVLAALSSWHAGNSGNMRYYSQIFGLRASEVQNFLTEFNSYFADC